MGIRIRDVAGVLRTVSQIRMRDASNVLRTITRIRMRDASNVLRTVYEVSSFFVTLSDHNPTGAGAGSGIFGSVTSETTTGTVSGGTAPYTYLWEQISGPGTVTANSPNSASTSFTDSAVGEGTISTSEWRLKVTDNTAAVVYSSYAIVEMTWDNTDTVDP